MKKFLAIVTVLSFLVGCYNIAIPPANNTTTVVEKEKPVVVQSEPVIVGVAPRPSVLVVPSPRPPIMVMPHPRPPVVIMPPPPPHHPQPNVHIGVGPHGGTSVGVHTPGFGLDVKVK
jgi:hypothetical protein